MKALSLVGMFFSVFLIFLGITSRKNAGNVLSNAIIVGGALIAAFVIIVWLILFFKERRDKR